MAQTVLVTGASGFIGSHLTRALTEAGHDVRAMTRNPMRYRGTGKPVAGDVGDRASLDAPLAGVDVAYSLVPALGSDDFERRAAEAARNSAAAGATAGVQRIVYLGGLGDDDTALSAHLRSRREVEKLLTETDVPVT